MQPPALSIILPVLNEAGGVAAALQALAPWRAQGVELIVVDGGSDDATLERCAGRVDHAIVAPRGRARQMNAGAARARGEVLLFLHADTLLPPDAPALVASVLASGHHRWGRFDVAIVGRSRWFPLIAALMNWRSRASGIATGDQAIFVRRDAFAAVGGFPDQPLMEDIELSRRLRSVSHPACLRERVLTSGRRWDRHGVLRTIALMWWLRGRYWLGTPAERLARSYR